MRIAVLGVGLIGGSIGLAAKERGGCEVVGFDPDPETLERGVELGALDRGAASVADACGLAEAVFCAAPVAALPGLAQEAFRACGPDTVITDVGSTKREIVAALGVEFSLFVGNDLE
jgi:prephenate dehydrogenase